jgi:hypothetical protein
MRTTACERCCRRVAGFSRIACRDRSRPPEGTPCSMITSIPTSPTSTPVLAWPKWSRRSPGGRPSERRAVLGAGAGGGWLFGRCGHLSAPATAPLRQETASWIPRATHRPADRGAPLARRTQRSRRRAVDSGAKPVASPRGSPGGRRCHRRNRASWFGLRDHVPVGTRHDVLGGRPVRRRGCEPIRPATDITSVEMEVARGVRNDCRGRSGLGGTGTGGACPMSTFPRRCRGGRPSRSSRAA